ncbi:MAG: Flp pilus assembly complex ATPase component TadA [Pseudobdellovibrionaceae bacterium]|nr:MAG: Flp pilus assembly complex ATPase component TadA [Pseudobdellovibrionaceae bacterium]
MSNQRSGVLAIHENSHLIVVAGGKGGVGKSVFAANLAITLMQEMRSKTLLIDLDARSCGDQNVILGVRPNKTVNDLTQFKASLTAQTLSSLLTGHSSGLSYLGAVQTPDQTLAASPELFKKQLYSVSQHFKFIIADIGNDLQDLQMAAIENASVILLVSTPEVLVVNQTKKMLHDLVTATVPAEMVQVVINKMGRNALNPNSIAQSLNRPIIGLIANDEATAYSSLQRSAPFMLTTPNSPMAQGYRDVARRLTGGLLQKLKTTSRPKNLRGTQSTSDLPALDSTAPSGSQAKGQKNEMDAPSLLKAQIHHQLIREMDLKKDLTSSKGDPSKEKELRDKTTRVVSQLTDRMASHLSREERGQVIKQVLDEALGLGPLEELLEDARVTEIMVNGAKQIYIEKSGKIQLSPVTFTSNQQLKNVIERIVTPLGRRIDEKTPYVDARLADGSRVNAVIEPLAIDGPAVTIRKFPSERVTILDYTDRFKSMTRGMADFLRICVEQGLNIIISGGTGTGKTTLLNVLSGFIPTNERIITVEDAAELQLKQEHVVRLETRPANMEGAGEISIRDLIRNSLRMRPDRIVVGETRDGAALDMLAAMNTGHDGSMTTVHSNNPREAISRLETLCLMAGMDLPARAIREQIASAVNLIVQITRFSDGSRKISSITEIVGMQGEAVTMQEIFRFKETGFDKNRKVVGQFQAMGRIPTFIEKFEQRGIMVPRDLFTSNGGASDPNSPAAGSKAGPTPVRPRTQTATTSSPRPQPLKKASGDGTSGGEK